MSENTSLKAVIYARYSSDNQREESIEGQIRECTAFAEKNGITILRHYIDRAFSAKTDNRPEFQNMIKDSGKKLFDMVIVWKLDRFARNRYDSARYKALLKKNGVKVVSATEVISEGAEGIILESVLEGYAEYYSADLAEKVVRGMTDNALKAKFNGGTVPIGYVIDEEQHFQLNPQTAPFVLEAYKMYNNGSTLTEIRDWLNEHSITTTLGKPITYNTIQHMMRNRRYIGEYKFHEIVLPDAIPAIVPIELFNSVQEKLEANKKAPARHKAEDDYLLTTKIFCGHCGAYMCGESGTSRTGVVHHYYKCVSVKKKRAECSKKPVKKNWIEDIVVKNTMDMVTSDEMIEAIISQILDLQERESTTLPFYEQQLRETEAAIENMLNAIQQGILTPSTKTRLEQLEATKQELEYNISIEKLAKPRLTHEQLYHFLIRFRKLDMTKQEHRKMLIDTFVNAIYLYDDKGVITFNYKDGTKTVSFSELNAALTEQRSGSDLDCSGAPEKGKSCSDFPFSGAAPLARMDPLRSNAKEDSRPLSRSSHADLKVGSDLNCPGAPRQNKAMRSCGGTSTATSTDDLVFPFQPRPADAGIASDRETGSDLDWPGAPEKGLPKGSPFSGAAPLARMDPLRSNAKEDSRPLSRSSHADLPYGRRVRILCFLQESVFLRENERPASFLHQSS